MKKIGIIGAGSWGTALATVVADKGNPVKIWDIDAGHLQRMEENRENVDYLPGVPLGENIAIALSQEDALRDADVVLFSAPAQHFRSALEGALPYIKDDALIINVAKGIEQKSLKRMSEIAADVLDMDRYVMLSGPSHAEEVGRGLPTTCVISGPKRETAEYLQGIFTSPVFRVYTTPDTLGVELGGSLKNVIALAAGTARSIRRRRADTVFRPRRTSSPATRKRGAACSRSASAPAARSSPPRRRKSAS